MGPAMGGSSDGVHVHGFWVWRKWVLCSVLMVWRNQRCCQSPFACHYGYPFFVVGWLILILILTQTQKPLRISVWREERVIERGDEKGLVWKSFRDGWGWLGSDGERKGMTEKREAWCVMKELQWWRERDERPWREKGLIFMHKILIYLLPLSYSAILRLELHYSTNFFFFFFFFAIVTFYNL